MGQGEDIRNHESTLDQDQEDNDDNDDDDDDDEDSTWDP